MGTLSLSRLHLAHRQNYDACSTDHLSQISVKNGCWNITFQKGNLVAYMEDYKLPDIFVLKRVTIQGTHEQAFAPSHFDCNLQYPSRLTMYFNKWLWQFILTGNYIGTGDYIGTAVII